MSCAAAVAALALHVPFIAPVLWGGGAFAHPQERKYPGDAATLQWIILEDSSSHSAGITAAPSPSLSAIGVTDALPKLPAESLSSLSGQSDDRTGLGAIYGRYLGQIQARVDRAWLRPRTGVGGPIFQCQVQLDQDKAGRVLAVTLLECNGDARWRVSLVHAIEAASPLPAPPNPAVFVDHVLLTFRAAAYSPGAPVQLYEPPGAVPVAHDPDGGNTRPRDAFQALAEATRAHSSRAINLRIEGSKVEVEPQRQ